MRYTVRFTAAAHLAKAEEMWVANEPMPEGTYRALDVVVEAPDAAAAIATASERLGWPDAERTLVPVSVIAEAQARGDAALIDSVRALLDFWRTHDMLADPETFDEIIRPRG